MTRVIVIDAGHGGHDPGATANGLREKDLVLDIAKRLRTRLSKYSGLKVIMTRTTDKFLNLSARANIANKANADMFVSIHINAGGGIGFESFIFNGNVSNKTKVLQNNVHDAIMAEIGGTDRGKKTANFAVVRQTKMPALLTENLFIDRKEDAAKLKESKFLDKIAAGHEKGIVKFLGLNKKATASKPEPTKKSKPSFTGAIADIQNGINVEYNFSIAVDNIAGVDTKKHLIMAYQTELNRQYNAGLDVDGIWGPKTARASVNIYKGAKGKITWLLQAMLVIHDYNIDVDGIYGKDTEKALRSFQRANKLAVDAIAGRATFARLFA